MDQGIALQLAASFYQFWLGAILPVIFGMFLVKKILS